MAVVKTLIGNIKGPKGDTGEKGDKGDKGDIGATGQRGSRWIQGNAITGTNTVDTVFSESGISDALVNDNYLNTSTGNTYRCTVAGDASTAKWVYSGNIKGVKGDTGAKGDKGDTGATGPQGPQGEYAAVDSVLSKTSTNPIQNKAVAEELEKKLNSDGDSKDLTTTFTSNDSTNVTEWTDVGLLTSGEKHSSMLQKIATMFKNVRYLYHMLGTADISTLGEGANIGTVTGAISKLNSDKQWKFINYLKRTKQEYFIYTGQYDEFLFVLAQNGADDDNTAISISRASLVLPRAWLDGNNIEINTYIEKRTYASIAYSSNTFSILELIGDYANAVFIYGR